jgi:hypothetical protein
MWKFHNLTHSITIYILTFLGMYICYFWMDLSHIFNRHHFWIGSSHTFTVVLIRHTYSTDSPFERIPPTHSVVTTFECTWSSTVNMFVKHQKSINQSTNLQCSARRTRNIFTVEDHVHSKVVTTECVGGIRSKGESVEYVWRIYTTVIRDTNI